MRMLEIGPGERMEGFETFDILPGADQQGDARKLPYEDGTFDLVYASHVIEHFPWYETVDVLKEWVRVLKDDGIIELWTVDAFKVAEYLVGIEIAGPVFKNPDPWRRFNQEGDPYLWCAGRMFAYQKPGEGGEYNWHKALFTKTHLSRCLIDAGCASTVLLDKPRGYDHGPINLGVGGIKA